MRKFDLQLFSGGHSVTVYKDAHMTTANASSTSDVQKDAEVTLTLEPATGYEVDEIEVIAGGVTITTEDETTGFVMGNENVVLYVKSKANNVYKVTESQVVYINGNKTSLTKNTKVILTKQGGISAVECDGSTVTVNDGVQSLIDQGILEKM